MSATPAPPASAAPSATPALLAQLQTTIAALEAQRALLGDAVVDTAVGPLRAQLAALAAKTSAETAAETAVEQAAEPPAVAAEQTLRQLTILFLDVVGSTALSQKLDPEETHAVMDDALLRCTAHVRTHGGRVLQYAGDNLLAVFGADEAREDDAERATLAGLDMLTEGRLLGVEVLRKHGHEGFDVRVGLHTGAVLLGGGVDGEGSIRGMAVNIAARMEQTAPPGGLRISQSTYRLVRGIFDVQAQPPISVKGISEPIATYLVQRAKPRAFRTGTRGIEGVHTRMVGREAELQQLQQAFQTLQAQGGLQMVLVVAEAGVGKSRLLYEFNQWAETRQQPYFTFQGRADPRTQTQAFGLLRDVLAWQLQIADADSMAQAKAKVEAGIAPLFMADDGPELAQAHAHLLGHLIGLDFSESPHLRGILDDPKQIRTRAFHAAAQAFRRYAARGQRPVVLQLDDLHWSDEGSLEFLNHLRRVNRDAPMLIVGLTRPTLFERREEWRDAAASLQRIDIQPLDKTTSALLAGELLKRLPSVPAALSELVVGRADGNPFYMEELVKMLVDQGAINTQTPPGADPETGQWTLNSERLLGAAVPPTLTGILQARLDGLPAAERAALQKASVVGMVFWEETLAALDQAAPAALPALVSRELALPHDVGSLDGANEYGFKHQILHEVTYDTLLRRTRRELHARAAAWFAGLTGVRATGLLGSAAWHYDKAGDTAQAAEFYTRAAEEARKRYAHEAALDYMARALELLEGDDSATALAQRWRVLDARERTYEVQGRRPEQRADLEQLEALAERLGDDSRRAELAVRRSLLAGRSGDYRGQESAARAAMALAERAQDTNCRLNAQRLLADALSRLGDPAAGAAIARAGLAEAQALELPGPESRFLNALSVIAARRNDIVELLETSRRATRLRRELGDRRNEAIGLASLGSGWLDLGQFEQARLDLDASLRLLRAMGDHAMEPMTVANLSLLALWEGQAELAASHARAALAVATEVQAQELRLFALWCLGQALEAQGQLSDAQASYAEVCELARSLGAAQLHDGQAGLARLALARGDRAGALLALQPVLLASRADDGLDGTLGLTLVQLSAWQVLHNAGDPRAKPLLQRAAAALNQRAAEISDPALRLSFTQGVPANRELLAAWARLSGPAYPGLPAQR